MIQGTIKRGDRNVIVIDQLRSLDGRIVNAAAKGLAIGLEAVITTAQREFLSGPRPMRLDIVTRRLRDSLSKRVSVTEQGVIGVVGTNVSYARYHEFGFTGTENVKAHKRIHSITGTKGEPIEVRRTNKATGTNLRFTENSSRGLAREQGRKNAGTFNVKSGMVRAHTRRVDYKGRPFIAPALAKNRTLILNQIKSAIDSAIAPAAGAGPVSIT